MTKICRHCGNERSIERFHHRKGSNGSIYGNTCFSCRGKRDRAILKCSMMDALGWECECCGENNPYFLTLDHVNNNGSEHREKYNEQQIYRLARREGFDRNKWQCLCMNCNFAKGHFGKCPHELHITPEVAKQQLREMSQGIGRGWIQHNPDSYMKPGFDSRRMQLNRRVLKPCTYCGEEFGSNEMVRHRKEKHAVEMTAKRVECLAKGRFKNVMYAPSFVPSNIDMEME